MVSVLFVCLGNICRSPSAEGAFRKIVEDRHCDDWINIDSAGTHAYHIDSAPDKRALPAAKKRGIDNAHLRGRQFVSPEFEQFDYILAMDNENYHNLLSMCPEHLHDSISLFLSYAKNNNGISEVPDPYYGGADGFEQVLDLVEDASNGLLDKIVTLKNN